MIEFSTKFGGVELRLTQAGAREWLDALQAGAGEFAAIRDGRAYALHLLRSEQEWIRIQALRCELAVDADSIEYLCFLLEEFSRLGHVQPELWHLPDFKTGRERWVYLFDAARSA